MMIGNLNSQGTQGFPLTYVRFFRDGGKAEPTFLSVEEMAASADGSLHAPIQSGFKFGACILYTFSGRTRDRRRCLGLPVEHIWLLSRVRLKIIHWRLSPEPPELAGSRGLRR